MNRRSSIRMSDDEARDFLASHRTVQVASLNRDGTPHLVTMWYALRDGDVAFWTYGKSQKAVNLRRDPRIAILVEDGDDYSKLRGVSVNGRAEIVDDRDAVLAFGEALHLHGSGGSGPVGEEQRARIARMGAKRVIVVVHPERVVSWDHSKLG